MLDSHCTKSRSARMEDGLRLIGSSFQLALPPSSGYAQWWIFHGQSPGLPIESGPWVFEPDVKTHC